MNREATEHLKKMKAVDFRGADSWPENDGLQLITTNNMELLYRNDNKVEIRGGGKKYPVKELIQMIQILNAEEGEFEYVNYISPRAYAESLEPIPLHISTQGIFFAEIDQKVKEIIEEIDEKGEYGKHAMDKVWLPVNKSKLQDSKKVYVMNRRVGGWDGDRDRPVIELLGAGGHIPCIWNEEENTFKSINCTNNLQKEIAEEMKIFVAEERLILLGGFHNKISNELVLVYGIKLSAADLRRIIRNTKNNYQENINGVYLGDFYDVIESYKKDAKYFAGGERAKKYNFPMQDRLMKKINHFYLQFLNE